MTVTKSFIGACKCTHVSILFEDFYLNEESRKNFLNKLIGGISTCAKVRGVVIHSYLEKGTGVIVIQ